MNGDNDNERLVNFRPLLFAAVGLIAGIIFCVRTGAAPNRLFSQANTAFKLAAAAVPLLAVACAVYGAVRGRGRLFVIAAFFLVGIARVFLAVPDSIAAERAVVTGTVKSVSFTDTAAEVELCRVTLDNGRLRYGVLVTVKMEDGERPAGITASVGDRVSVACTDVRVPTQYYGTYDQRLAMLARGVSLLAKAGESNVTVLPYGGSPLLKLTGRTREAVGAMINRLFGDNSALVSAFIIGRRDGVPDEVYDSFASAGVAHLLTLSGFHVGVVAALLFALLPERFRTGRFILIDAFLLCYCAVAGFAASLVRASLMCMCVLFADAVARRPDPLSSLSLAAIIILLASPYKLWSAGFCLSFAATFGILAFTSYGIPKAESRLMRGLISSVFASVGATAASMLPTARYFGRFYTYGIAVNVVCMPLFSAAIVLCFVLTFAGFLLPNVCAALAVLPNALLNAAKALLNRAAMLPGAVLTTAAPSAMSCVLMLVLLFSASAYVLRPARKRIKYAAITLLLFTLSAFADIIPI